MTAMWTAVSRQLMVNHVAFSGKIFDRTDGFAFKVFAKDYFKFFHLPVNYQTPVSAYLSTQVNQIYPPAKKN